MALPIGYRNGVPIPIGKRSGIGRITPRHGIPFYSPADIYEPHDYILTEGTTITFSLVGTLGGDLHKVNRTGSALIQFFLIATLTGTESRVIFPGSQQMRGTTTIIFNQYGKLQGYQRMAGIIWFVFDCELKTGKMMGETQITFDLIGLAHNVVLKGETTITFTEQGVRTARAEMIGIDSDITFTSEADLHEKTITNIAAETTITFSQNAVLTPTYTQGDILLVNGWMPTKVYLYNPSLKTATEVTIPGIPTDYHGAAADIAHTENKLWLYQSPVSTTMVAEWDITLNPFSATFVRYIDGARINSGLHAIDDTTLITFSRNNGYYESDVTNTPCTNTLKFSAGSTRNVNGDYMLTTTGKLLSIEVEYDYPYRTWFVQYDYATGIREIAINISNIFKSAFIGGGPAAYGLFEHEGDIYIATDTPIAVTPYRKGEIFKINKTAPFEITLYDTLAFPVNGASQLAYRITAHLTPSLVGSANIQFTATTGVADKGYGFYYNWWAVALSNPKKIAKTGWHVHGYTEYSYLSAYLGGNSISGGKLKETGLTHWTTPNIGATDAVGFGARGAGARSYNGAFVNRNLAANFWTPTEANSANAYYANLAYNSAAYQGPNNSKNYGFSVRLAKDSTTLEEGQQGIYVGNNGIAYKTICMNGVEVMAENLVETKYSDGSSIPNVIPSDEWAALTTGAYCEYNSGRLTATDCAITFSQTAKTFKSPISGSAEINITTEADIGG